MRYVHPFSISVIFLGLASLACQPVIAIGWTELAIILVILIVLFAPLLFRVFRFFIQNKAPSDHENE
ncbi:MAG: twin-arginine translocase TatA/TatE family subunit [Anaerolineales bacterium]|jgi:hypothetical protein